MREVTLERNTNETQIELTLNLDGAGRYEVDTGCGFLNHMLELFARHGRFDLVLTCHGDVEVDYHHTAEDIGIALGQAFARALGEMRGIQRYGSFYLPMDEALVLCAVDLSGRCTLNWDVHCKTEKVGDSMWNAPRSLAGLARNVPATLHLYNLQGKIPTTSSKPASRGQATHWLRQSPLMPPTGTRSLPRKDCWYDRDHRLRRGQPVQPALQPDASGAGGRCDRRCTDHPQG